MDKSQTKTSEKSGLQEVPWGACADDRSGRNVVLRAPRGTLHLSSPS